MKACHALNASLAATAALALAALANSASEEGEYSLGPDEPASGGHSTFDAAAAELLPHLHVKHPALDAALSARAWTNFVDSLDSQHAFFTREDAEAFVRFRADYARRVAAGDLSFAKEAFDVLLRRVEDRAAYAAAAVSNEIDWAAGGEFRERGGGILARP